MSLSIQVPTVGQANSTEAVKVTNSLTNLSTWANGNIPGSDLSSSAAIADTQLASPNNSVGRPVLNSSFAFAGTGGTGFVQMMSPAGGILQSGGSTATLPLHMYMGDEASEWAVAGKSTFAKLRVSLVCNAGAMGGALTYGLYPISTVSGGAGSVVVTLGSVVASSTVAITPTTSAASTGVSSQFSLPTTAGTGYIVAVLLPNASNTSSIVWGRYSLRVYNA